MQCVVMVWGKQPHKANRENYLYLVSAAVGTFARLGPICCNQ